jgi:hypothetical protein
MPHPIFRFLKFVVDSRLAQFLFLVHLVLVVYAVYFMPLANPHSWGFTIPDFLHSDEEGRFVILGQSGLRHSLVVVHAYREEASES